MDEDMFLTLKRRHLLAPLAVALKAIPGQARRTVLVTSLIAMLAPMPASAAVGPQSADAASRTQILSSFNATGDLEIVPAGLHILLGEGWKTYWRSPGDAGMPPRMDWSGSTNVASVDG
jgi:suppressor for copper-sensitivity B